MKHNNGEYQDGADRIEVYVEAGIVSDIVALLKHSKQIGNVDLQVTDEFINFVEHLLELVSSRRTPNGSEIEFPFVFMKYYQEFQKLSLEGVTIQNFISYPSFARLIEDNDLDKDGLEDNIKQVLNLAFKAYSKFLYLKGEEVQTGVGMDVCAILDSLEKKQNGKYN